MSPVNSGGPQEKPLSGARRRAFLLQLLDVEVAAGAWPVVFCWLQGSKCLAQEVEALRMVQSLGNMLDLCHWPMSWAWHFTQKPVFIGVSVKRLLNVRKLWLRERDANTRSAKHECLNCLGWMRVVHTKQTRIVGTCWNLTTDQLVNQSSDAWYSRVPWLQQLSLALRKITRRTPQRCGVTKCRDVLTGFGSNTSCHNETVYPLKWRCSIKTLQELLLFGTWLLNPLLLHLISLRDGAPFSTQLL